MCPCSQVFSQLEAILLIQRASVGNACNAMKMDQGKAMASYTVNPILGGIIMVHIVQIGGQKHDHRHQREFMANDRHEGSPDGTRSEDAFPRHLPVDSFLAHMLGGVRHCDESGDRIENCLGIRET